MIEVRDYIDAKGRITFRDWVAKLDALLKFESLSAVLRMEQGNFSTAKPVGSRVSELRLDLEPGYRVYFAKDGETLVILLDGGTKKRQQADIVAAHALWAECKRRKREE